MTTYSNAKDLLIAARDNLVYRGWGRVELKNPETGCVCALGAITTLLIADEDDRDEYSLFEDGQRPGIQPPG